MEESKDKPKQILNWEKSRKLGQHKYTLLIGVGWGLVTAIVGEIILAFVFKSDEALTIKSLLPRMIILSIFGYFYSRWYWNNNEKKYQQWLKNNAKEEKS